MRGGSDGERCDSYNVESACIMQRTREKGQVGALCTDRRSRWSRNFDAHQSVLGRSSYGAPDFSARVLTGEFGLAFLGVVDCRQDHLPKYLLPYLKPIGTLRPND